MDQETKDFFVAQLRQLSADIDAKMDARFEAQTKSFDAKFDAQAKSFDVKLSEIEDRFDSKFDAQAKNFDAKLDARLEDIVGVIQDFTVMVGSKIDGLDARVEVLEDNARVTRDILLRMESGLKEKVDIQGDRIQVAFHRIERIEDRLQLEHNLVCEKPKKPYVPQKS